MEMSPYCNIKVENVLFKLHRDILAAHSTYFRDSLNMAESGDGQAISNEDPLNLPSNICSADTFNKICSFLYPRAIGVFPIVLVQELGEWDVVLQATTFLGMTSLREYIISRFEDDTTGVTASAAKLLGLVMRYEETPDSLKIKCLNSLIFLRRALSASEVTALGGETTAQVVAIRDRVRILIVTSLPYWTTIQRHYLCDGTNCQQFLHEGIFNNIKDMDPLNELYQADSSIFDIAQDNRICGYCNSVRDGLARTMAKQELETEIHRCAMGLGLLRAGGSGSQ
ncbi:unnamed protein product [Rhizoctonia solani]|uniref:BTB domain-containing protein n=1 Tax=Rhizoctonia solani TaxID=456999 RepID=A0A8H2XLP8_9AGAM|nr:unnamed protein product [Rhizoctonia solani]